MRTHSTSQPVKPRRILLVGFLLVSSGVLTCLVSMNGIKGDVGPNPAKLDAIQRIERLGGFVGIDGEAPDQPVWKVDFTNVPVDAAAIRLLNSFPKLESLHLNNTAIGDDLLKHVGEIRTLKELSLADTKITDVGLKHLIKLDKLEQLDVSGTLITDEGLLQLALLQKLGQVSYADSRVTSQGIEKFVDAQRRYQTAASGTKPPIPRIPEAPPATELPTLIAARSHLGETLHDLGRTLFPTVLHNPERRQEAVALLEQAFLTNPNSEQIQLDLADAYMQLSTEETLTLAIGIYEDVLARHPRGNDALLARIADAYSRLGNFDAAIAVAAARLRTEVKSPFPAALQIADFAAQSSDLERGIDELTGVVRGYPEDAGVRLLLASLLLDLNQPAVAVPHIDAALELLPAESPLAQVARHLQERTRP